ncbi:MAG: RNA-binding protein [Bacteroidota bacterium]
MNLFIGNLSLDSTTEDLRNIFSEFGEIVVVRVVMDKDTGISRGFGFVEYADKFTAFDAIDAIDGTYLHGNIISVKEAKTQPNDRKGSGSKSSFRGPSKGGVPSRSGPAPTRSTDLPLRPRFKRKLD